MEPLRPQTSFQHVYVLAHAVLKDTDLRDSKRYAARPRSRFEPGDTMWWLVPSVDWPAYRYGKGVLRPAQNYPERVMCGLHIEKGFDPVVGTVYRALTQRGHILDRRWIWPDFMHDLSTGRVEEVARVVIADTGFPVICEIVVWYSTDPTDFDPLRVSDGDATADPCQRPGTAGYLLFEQSKEAFHMVNTACLTDLARPIATIEGLADLAKAFSEPQLKWAWIDLYIGTVVSLAARDRQTEPTEWDSQIWPRLMQPWSPWIR